MSVTNRQTNAMLMQYAVTPMEVTLASVLMVTQEMDLGVAVSTCYAL